MQLCINGQLCEQTEQLTISKLLEELQLEPKRVVVELNRKILTADTHAATILKDGDSLELIQFVGGG